MTLSVVRPISIEQYRTTCFALKYDRGNFNPAIRMDSGILLYGCLEVLGVGGGRGGRWFSLGRCT